MPYIFHDPVADHRTVEDIALADEVRHKGILRLVVDILRCADLLDAALVHDHHGVGHGQGFLLIVGDIYKRDAHLLLDTFQFVLHILTQTQIQRAQRLVQQQHLRPVHQGTGNRHTLLLTTGELVDTPAVKALQADDLQHFTDTLPYLVLRHFCDTQAEALCFQTRPDAETAHISGTPC